METMIVYIYCDAMKLARGEIKLVKGEGLDKIVKETLINNVDYYYEQITFELYNQKGISVLINTIPAILNNYESVKFIIEGQGEITQKKKVVEERCKVFVPP